MLKINNIPYHARFEKWANKQRTIRVKARFYQFLRFIIKPFHQKTSLHFEMKFLRNRLKIRILQEKNRFKQALVAPVFNIAKPQAARSEKGIEIAREWMKEIHQKLGKNVKDLVPVLKRPHSPIGLCTGMSIDVAAKLLIQNKPTEHVMQSLEKGCGSHAYASHLLYHMLLGTYRCTPSVSALIRLMKTTQNMPGAPQLPGFTMDDIEKLLKIKNEHDIDPLIESLRSQCDNEKDLREKAKYELAYQTLWLSELMRSRRSFTAEKEFLIDDILPPGNKVYNHWILSCCFLLNSTWHAQDVAAKRGLKLTQLVETMGLSGLCESDETYLSHLNQLPNGCYYIMIMTSPNAGHALTLVREEGKDTLIDPNDLILQSNSNDETKRLLKEVLSNYKGYHEAPDDQPNHRMIILKYEKAAL